MVSCSPFEKYQVGQLLSLSVIPEHGEVRPVLVVRARIRQLLAPCTLSCCMIVDLLSEDYHENTAFLKLCDRRFSDQLRDDYGIDAWTREAEKEYIDAVRTGSACQFLHELRTIPDLEEDTGEDWNDSQIETFLAEQARSLFDAETTVYDVLRDIQGELVPQLMERIQIVLSLPDTSSDATDLLCIKGILLQYIEGFSLSKLQNYAPESIWQDIVNQAIAIVQIIGDHGVLNRDVRPDNFIVQHASSGCYRVFMIDFGLARLRGSNESDREWAKAKLIKDEEGAVGLVMKKRLAKEGFRLQFQNSDRYMEWAGGDDE